MSSRNKNSLSVTTETGFTKLEPGKIYLLVIEGDGSYFMKYLEARDILHTDYLNGKDNYSKYKNIKQILDTDKLSTKDLAKDEDFLYLLHFESIGSNGEFPIRKGSLLELFLNGKAKWRISKLSGNDVDLSKKVTIYKTKDRMGSYSKFLDL